MRQHTYSPLTGLHTKQTFHILSSSDIADAYAQSDFEGIWLFKKRFIDKTLNLANKRFIYS